MDKRRICHKSKLIPKNQKTMVQRNLISIEIDTTDKVSIQELDTIRQSVVLDSMRYLNNKGINVVMCVAACYQKMGVNNENTNN